MDSINALRKSEGLSVLDQGKPLNKAAEDQAKYNRKSGRIHDEQHKRKKVTVADRIKYYNGMYHASAEFDMGMNISVRSALKSHSRSRDPSTYQEAVAEFMEEWNGDRRKNELLRSREYFEIGIGIAPNKYDKSLFLTVVLGSEPYEKHPGFNYDKKSYKIAPYDRSVCKGFERNFAYISELFADNLRINGKKIQFYHHNLSLMESLIETGKDRLAVDIIFKDQFSCDHGNVIHPSPIQKGMMLKPVNKCKLMGRNPLEEQGEFLADLGRIPAGVDTSDITINLLVIKDKCLCKTIPYNDLNGKNLRLLEIDLAVDTLSISQSVDSNSRYLTFTVPFEQSTSEYQVEDIKPFLDSIELNRFNIKEIEIKAYSSIEGNALINKNLQEKRANSIMAAISEYQLQEAKTQIQTFENWDGFMESIKGSPYEDEFRGLNHEEIRARVNADTLGYDLEPYLAPQRKADIKIWVESIFIDSLTPEFLPDKFRRAVEDKEYIRATALQTLLYRAVMEGKLNKKVLFETEIPQYEEYISLLNNRLAFHMQFNDSENQDSLINLMRQEVEALLGIQAGNGHLNYNRQVIKLYYWAKDLTYLVVDHENRIDQVRDFEREIRKLYNTKIDNYKVNRLRMNFNIIAADFYYEREEFRERIRALKQVYRYVKKARLDRAQTFRMARYFIYQMQIEWAINIMLPYIKSGDYDADFLLTFLSIAVYDERTVSKEDLYKYTRIAADKFTSSYCQLYDKPGMSVDFLTDLEMKEIYCVTCKK